ncbi:DUF2201 family putative metallopeptidase [Sulfurovum sp. ST-21]|uniref:VWA-like domain-containing protein n=1 Tax=Sulfurovum indicum TaxID=2779528 RepID=A0A7M1S5V1_9BACT|nr:VWA-like domain-containing protein [Sulfurovum indicum]QOR62797.1 hypothetical protein IMZ28_04835 [Sulfurovum indicum]
MIHKEKIEKAKAKLMLEHPYIGSVATLLRLDDNKETLTFSSDGISLKYNDEYFEKAPLDEIEFALANGAMHAVLKHHERVNDRVGRIWQAATDLAVNSMLVKNDFILPPYVYYDERFEGMYAEEIYDVLKDEMIYNNTLDEAEAPTPDDVPENSGKEQPKNEKKEQTEQSRQTPPAEQIQPDEILQAELEALHEELQEHFEQIFQKFKRQGELPKGLEIVVPEYFSHKVNWQELLYRYIAEFAKSTYSFVPPNMKYLYRGIYLPSLSSDLLRIAIAIDTSGSVEETLLSTFLGEVESIMQSYMNYEIDLITADAKVQSHKVFLPGEALEYQVSGGGGTDFRPTFEYIDREISYPTLLLYFTDAMGTFPESEPNYDVMWVLPEAKEVPFGEVIVLGN